MTKTVLIIPGLDCPAEEKLIVKRLHSMTGIENLECNFVRQELIVTHTLSEMDGVVKAIEELGMKASVKAAAAVNHNKPLQTNGYKTWIFIAIAGSLALFAEGFSYISGAEKSPVVMIMAALAIILSGRATFKKGLLAIKTFTLNINFLMMVAIGGALAIGEWPEAAMVTVLFAIAELIERYSLDKARNAIASLMEMAPEEANVKAEDGTWRIQAVADIEIDKIIWVKPGERIPLDGVITQGKTSINQAPVTGESIPVEKNVGDAVYAGTINERGSFEFKVTAKADKTLLSKIIRAVEEAQAERAPTQRFVDQFSKFYTPIMVALAIIIAILPPIILGVSFAPWIYKALVLLVIACPCALVISTPVTVVSGLAAAAKHGLLIKGGVYLEKGNKLRAIALDKTGTLTQGKPIVTNIISLNNFDQALALKLAASLDVHSEHPVAFAIVSKYKEDYASGTLLAVSEFEAIVGRGVTGIIDNIRYFVGNHQLAEDNKVCNKEVEAALEDLEKAGKTTVVLSTEKEILAILAVADTVRVSSKEAVSALHKLGVTTVMITGDNALTAQAIAKEVGIDTVKANMLPEQKLAVINELIAKYTTVGMVGDGINDAPALAKASIGFAMGSAGTDVALETADVALMEDNLNKLPLFITLSRTTSRTLKQNIAFSIAIKLIFFVLALMGLATLWMAVFADMGASLIVVFNGLRLLKFKGNSKCCISHSK